MLKILYCGNAKVEVPTLAFVVWCTRSGPHELVMTDEAEPN